MYTSNNEILIIASNADILQNFYLIKARFTAIQVLITEMSMYVCGMWKYVIVSIIYYLSCFSVVIFSNV
jgi:hypothetical protein